MLTSSHLIFKAYQLDTCKNESRKISTDIAKVKYNVVRTKQDTKRSLLSNDTNNFKHFHGNSDLHL